MRFGSCILIVFILSAYALSPAQCETQPRKQLYYWLWNQNMEGYWQDFIDFAAEQKIDGVVIWGLKGWMYHGEDRYCRELVKYAHSRNVKVIHGLGLNGYEIGEYVVEYDPDLGATIPESLTDTRKAKSTRKAVFCPSKPKSIELLRECILRAADTGVDGFNFETADVDYLTCHCQDCERRFDSADETEHENKPIAWPLEHLEIAADVLSEPHPNLWLNCEFALQRFGKPPYTDCERILELNRKIDPRITVVWAEETAPPQQISDLLRKERENIGFYIRSGGIHGWNEKERITPSELLPVAKRLLGLDPVCMFYRAYRPNPFWSVNMGAAAEILHNPEMTQEEVSEAVQRLKDKVGRGN